MSYSDDEHISGVTRQTNVWRQTLKIRGQVSYWWMPWFRHNQTSEFSIKNVSEFDVIKNV
jgi:homoserine trans-succinylase